MKKAFCFSLIVMFLALAGITPVKADDVTVVTPYVDTPNLTQSEIDQYTYSTMLMEYLRCGGTIDVHNKSDNYSALDLLEDFGEFVKDVIGDVVDVINPFQSEFQWGKGYPLSKATPATLQLMGLLPFYAISQDGEPTPEPPIDFASYIDTINGTGFFWKNYSTNYNLGGGYTQSAVTIPYSNYSWYSVSTSSNLNNVNNNIIRTYGSDIVAATKPTDIITFNLNNNGDDTYTIIYTWRILDVCIKSDWNNYPWNSAYFYKNYNRFEGLGNNTNTSSINYTDTLEGCLQHIARNFRNVNIYVDGTPWSIVGTSTSYNIELSTSTVTPSGERVRWMYDKEIYVDMDKIVEKLDEILDDIDNIPNTPTIIKFDDLDDVIVDIDGQPAIAVKVLQDDRNIDDLYLATYGPIIPAFLPLFTPVIDDVDIITIADNAVSPIPDDLIEVFGYMFMGVLFVGFIHRLLE